MQALLGGVKFRSEYGIAIGYANFEISLGAIMNLMHPPKNKWSEHATNGKIHEVNNGIATTKKKY